MKKNPADITINLVPKDPFFETPVGRFLQWALSAGRYLVIFTELIVIGSFLTRFTLDRQITDLNNEILQKEQQIQSFSELESSFRMSQARIQEYNQVSRTSNLADVFPQLTSITPSDVFYESMSITDSQIVLSGTTLSQSSFATLINNIQLSTLFKNVIINTIEAPKSNEPGYVFNILASTKDETNPVIK